MSVLCSMVGGSFGLPPATYAVAAAGGATSVNEGSALTFNVTGTNIDNGTYYFTVNTNAGDFGTSSGSFTITSNAGSFSVTPTADATTEGAETFTVSVRTVSTSGTVVATSSSITINDTSTAPAFTGVDANAGTLRLAVPFNATYGLDDVSHRYSNRVNTVMTPRSGPTGGAVAITTANSKFYGSSAFGQRTGQALLYTLPVNLNTASTFLLEFWAWTTATTSNNWIWGDGYSAIEVAVGISAGGSLSGAIGAGGGNGRINTGNSGVWNHFAFSNQYWWFNGTRRGTFGASNASFNQLRIMQQEVGDPNNFLGYIQDLRVYIGSNKYGTATSITVPGAMV